ncbi:hypothetical protein BMS3Bbin06_02232 [bacterium BMS3Bbin06]|nr:hypothetical protein BMS3Bbin06_02232 [bacterium BMS3Bbin06]HDO35228.1 hypothetical protein [Nitrospirota bacterium]
MGSPAYKITLEDGRVILETRSFRSDRGSVLHSGIFSRELSASFIAAAAMGAVLGFFALITDLGLVHYVIGILVFAVVFPLSRLYILKEPYLETVFDGEWMTISLKRPIFGTRVKRPVGELKEIKIGHVKFEPENADAIAFVKKIALQHGTVIPGFGEVKEFYNVDLDFGDKSYTILTTHEKKDAEDVVLKLREFL